MGPYPNPLPTGEGTAQNSPHSISVRFRPWRPEATNTAHTNPYVQALADVSTPAAVPGGFSILAVVLAGYGLMIWASSFDANSYPGPHINLVLWVSVLLAVHIREQFADPRAHLMPGFRRATWWRRALRRFFWASSSRR